LVPVGDTVRAIPIAALLAEGLPDRIARRRDASGETWLAASGRGYRLDPASPLAGSEWIVIADAQGEAKGARITAAIALDQGDLLAHLAHRIESRARVGWNAADERAESVRERRIGAVTLSRGSDASADRAAVAARLVAHFHSAGLAALPLSEGAQSLLKRAAFAEVTALSPDALTAGADEWLTPLIGKATSLRDIAPARLAEALYARLSWDERQALDRLAPPSFTSPAGSSHAIDYADPGGPSVEVRVQALFGLDAHPTFGRPPQPLLLKLTSPAGRPLQTTRDLPQFWRGSWRDVQREMKGRYPRHRWPDRPWEEDPSLKTRNAFEASRRT
jgi:ATP-dependent helicase HrpB